MYEEDMKKKFIVWFKKYGNNRWVKTGERLVTGEYSPIINQLFTAKLGIGHVRANHSFTIR